jgi:sulfide dehydrogenase cytochrome subunit
MRMKLSAVAVALVIGGSVAHAQAPYPNTGRDLAASCAICHGTNGANAGGLPSLAGQPKDYIVKQLADFREGKRPATLMHQIAKGLTPAQVDAVAAFYAAQKAK